MSTLDQILSSKELTEQDKQSSCELAKEWRCSNCGTSCSNIRCAVLEMAKAKNNDSRKIEAIKNEIESTHLNTLEDMVEMLDSIIRIIYGADKKEKLSPKKNALV